MTTSEPMAPQAPAHPDPEPVTEMTDPTSGPIMTLRGAGVEVDGRRVARVLVGACLVALAVVVVVLFVAGFQKNAQINRLRQHGIPVKVTVSGCRGLMGGSGSNLVGYSCTGTFTVDGHRYSEAIPGNTLYGSGATLRGITVPGDPGLLTAASVLATEHSSWRVFIVPTILLVVLALLVGVVVHRR